MVLLGVDPHKDTHTVVAVDQAGRQLGQLTVAARPLGHAELVGWARRRWPEERVWAVEDCRHVTSRLECDLLAAGERVRRVPPRLLAGARHAVRAPGTSDPIDALAVARAALREPDLPTAGHDQPSWEVKLLVDHREHLIAERTRTINRFRWHRHQLDPTWSAPLAACLAPPGPGRRLAGRRPVVGSGRHRSGVDGRDWGADGAHRPARRTARPAGRPAGAQPAQPARLRSADRGQARR
jgi:transposase